MLLHKNLNIKKFDTSAKQTITFSKPKIETLEKSVNYVQS